MFVTVYSKIMHTAVHACSMHIGVLTVACIHGSELKHLFIGSKIYHIRLNRLKLLFYSATSSS